jgi:hypothetical protein
MLVILEINCSVIRVIIAVYGMFDRFILIVPFCILLLLTAACHTRLAISIQNIAQGSPKRLDERQRATRDQAFVTTWYYLSWLFNAAWIYPMLASFANWWLPTPQCLWLVLWGLGQFLALLPTAIIAWSQPDSMLKE